MVLLTPGSQSPVRKRYRRRILDEDRIAALESRARIRREPSLSPRRLTLHPEESAKDGQEQAKRGGEAGPAPRAKSPSRRISTDSTLTPQSSSCSEAVVSNRRSECTQPSAKNLGPVPDPLKVARVLSPHVKGKNQARSEDDLPTSMEQLLNVLPRTRTTIKSKTPGKKRDLRVDPFASPVPSPRPRQPAPRASALFRRAQEDSDEEELLHNFLGAADLAGMSSKTKTRYVERAAGGYLQPLVFDSEEASEYMPSDEECEVKKKTKKRKRAKQDAGLDDVKRLKKGEAAKGDFIRRTEQTAFAPLLARQARPAPKAAHRRAKPLARKNTVSGLGDQVSRATGLRIKMSARANQQKKPAGRRQTLDSRRQPLEFGFEEEAGDVAPSAFGDSPVYAMLASKTVHSRLKNRSAATPHFRHRFEPARLPPPLPFASFQPSNNAAQHKTPPPNLQQRSKQVEKVDPPVHPAPVSTATTTEPPKSKFRFDRGPKAHKALTVDAEKWYADLAEAQAQGENLWPPRARSPSGDAHVAGKETSRREAVGERVEQDVANLSVSAKKQKILRRLPTMPSFTFAPSLEQAEGVGDDIAGSREAAPRNEEDAGHNSSREFRNAASAQAARVSNAGQRDVSVIRRRVPTVLVPPTPLLPSPLPRSSFTSLPLPTAGGERLFVPSSSALFDSVAEDNDKASSSPSLRSLDLHGEGPAADRFILSDSPLLSRIPSPGSDSPLPTRSMSKMHGRRKVGRRLLSSSPSNAPIVSREPTSQLEVDGLVEQPPSDVFYIAGTETLEAAAVDLAVTEPARDEDDDFGTISLGSADHLFDLLASLPLTAMAQKAVDDKLAQVTQLRNDSILPSPPQTTPRRKRCL
ncbi:hypothetical protein NBRC10512_003056 [Rhodotorula toruloides]|uniref:RHTO0S20e02146g1_1 n=2 Tax=Rhodotorula toruloides TaxID=5286 RepID=A0A061BFT7_RHOTO|nr:uncharacterized protein RHTO_04340 [Rhodotorula toruloides NP11]EMS19565.1 hypothetical protein RHTO_04340 [Rhodotorula toruloides NP11]CDR48822.1 RHTO0S20e02146g1_1 [Rhodotorula toruloides]